MSNTFNFPGLSESDLAELNKEVEDESAKNSDISTEDLISDIYTTNDIKTIKSNDLIESYKHAMSPESDKSTWSKYYSIKAKFCNLFISIRHYTNKSIVSDTEHFVLEIANMFFKGSKGKSALFFMLLGVDTYKKCNREEIELTEEQRRLTVMYKILDKKNKQDHFNNTVKNVKNVLSENDFIIFCEKTGINHSDYIQDIVSEACEVIEEIETITDKIRKELGAMLGGGQPIATKDIKTHMVSLGFDWGKCRYIATQDNLSQNCERGFWIKNT